EPVSVDALFDRGVGEHACRRDAGDVVATYRHVAIEPWITGAVDDLAVGDDDVILLTRALLPSLRLGSYRAGGKRAGGENGSESAHVSRDESRSLGPWPLPPRRARQTKNEPRSPPRPVHGTIRPRAIWSNAICRDTRPPGNLTTASCRAPNLHPHRCVSSGE